MGVWFILGILGAAPDPRGPIEVRVPYNEAREVEVGELAVRLAGASGVRLARPKGTLGLPVEGLAGSLSRRTLADLLGPDARLETKDEALVIIVDRKVLDPAGLADWQRRLNRLSDHVEREARRRENYGMHALRSYRPNDPDRPTVCLVHGLNSSSGGFVHMVRPLEEAGYGLVVYDYPYNRDLAESAARFRHDWARFRRQNGETRAWAIVAHSMGALLARSYVEDPRDYAGDVTTLILIAPVNGGSSLAKAQTLLQFMHGVQAVQGKKSSDALAHLADGLGEAANDLLPGSRFLSELNARTRRPGVAYHILAGDGGLLSRATRLQVEGQIAAIRRQGGLLSGIARVASGDLSGRLDEISDGTGDGCVSVERTRLDGVGDHVTIHANHAELIRAPLLFDGPGPVACMPYLLRWLAAKPASGTASNAPR